MKNVSFGFESTGFSMALVTNMLVGLIWGLPERIMYMITDTFHIGIMSAIEDTRMEIDKTSYPYKYKCGKQINENKQFRSRMKKSKYSYSTCRTVINGVLVIGYGLKRLITF